MRCGLSLQTRACCFLLILTVVALLMAYIGIVGVSGLPLFSKVKEPVFIAVGGALMIAIVNIYFANMRLEKQEIIQLKSAERADERQSEEWKEVERRQRDFVDKENSAYEDGARDMLIFELKSIIDQTHNALENSTTIASHLQKGDRQKFKFTFTRCAFDVAKVKLPNLSEPFRKMILRNEPIISQRIMILEDLLARDVAWEEVVITENLFKVITEIRNAAIAYVLELQEKDPSIDANANCLLKEIFRPTA